jgi:hypothetical protein
MSSRELEDFKAGLPDRFRVFKRILKNGDCEYAEAGGERDEGEQNIASPGVYRAKTCPSGRVRIPYLAGFHAYLEPPKILLDPTKSFSENYIVAKFWARREWVITAGLHLGLKCVVLEKIERVEGD